MKEDERKKLGLVKELKYRYAFASGDFNFLQEKENTNYLRALARLGIRMDNGENDKYFTPESITEIKKKKKDSNYNTTLINPIYISDFQAPLEDYEIITTGGGALYEVDRLTGERVFIGNEPIVETKKVKRPAERRITPADVQLGLEGAGGTVNTTIPPEGTDNSIKKLKVAFATTWSPQIGSNQASAGVEIYTKPDGSFQKSQMGPDDDFNSSTSFTFDAFGYITVSGIKYSAIQVISPDESLTALQSLRNRKDPELDRLIDAWGLSESAIPTPVTPEGGEQREAPEAEEGGEQQTNATPEEVANTTANSSIMEKISALRGWKVSKDGQVEKDKKGNPIVVDKDPQISLGKSAEVTIDASGNVSIKGDVTINLPSKSDKVKLIENGKFAIPFGTIEGNFLCRKVGLTTLVGCPKVVKGTFDCSNNQITTLAGAPDEVGIFIANDNKSLASLTGGPKKINGITDTAKSQKEYIYDVSSCALTSLDGHGVTSFGPGGFNCGNNKITSLSGLGVISTTGVTKFDCSKNTLTSLVGAPKTVKDAKTGKPGDYNISNNKDVTSFPTSMADIEVDNFRATGLSLSSLSFAPKQVYGNFDCSGNNGKKLTNQSIGKDRFKVASGFEEDAGNRIVKIDGDFITSEGVWQDKTYDINTVYKESSGAVGAGAEGKISGDEPRQYPGTAIAPFVEILGGSIRYQEMTNIAVGYGGLASLTKYVPTEIGIDRIRSDRGEAPHPGATGKGGVQWSFPRKNRWPFKNYINWSYFELPANGWASGQTTGAFIVNGKNYGAKTADPIYNYSTIMLYLLKGERYWRYDRRSKDMFVAKTGATPNSQTPQSQARDIDNVLIAVPCPGEVVSNGRVTNETDRGFPFAGVVQNQDGSYNWFAGQCITGGQGEKMITEFNKKGKKIIKMWHGDGGSSFTMWNNGDGWKHNRPKASVPVVLWWN